MRLRKSYRRRPAGQMKAAIGRLLLGATLFAFTFAEARAAPAACSEQALAELLEPRSVLRPEVVLT